MQKTSIFQRPLWVSLFALTAAVVWGWAYPLIKLGFAEYHILPHMTGSKMLFAGIRFFISGLIILTMARLTGRQFALRSDAPGSKVGAHLYLLLFALLNTTLHYICFYVGLSYSQGSRAAILNSMSVFTVVILSCVFFRSDRFTLRKVAGCAVGIAGVLALNLGGDESGSFTLLGDGMILLNALCGAFASLMTRGVASRVDVFVGTGYSLALGGALLVIPALLLGGTLPNITLWGLVIMLLLIGISTTGFALYNKLLSCNPMGRVAIYNSLIPVVGALTSCLCLGETFHLKYLIAGTLAAGGIYIINKGK